MMVIVSYDVSTSTPDGRRRLRRVAKVCLNHGQRVQNSVFECLIEPDQWVHFRNDLLHIYKAEEDSFRFYFLGANWQRRVEHHGTKATPDLEGPLIV